MTQVAYGIAFPASRGVLAPPVAPVLDQVNGVTITGAWSLNRALLSGFEGEDRIRVRDTSGVGISFEDVASCADAVAFLNGDAGTVVSLYDQSGNSHTLTNATASQQPAFATGIGALSRAGAQFDNADDKLVGPALSNLMSVSSGYVVAVALFAALTANSASRYVNQALWCASGNIAGAFGRIGAIDSYNFSSNVNYAGGAAISADALFVHEWWHEGGALFSRINGGLAFSVASGDSAHINDLFILGKGTSGATAMNGTIVEAACMSGKPSQADDVVADMVAYYGIAA